MTNIIHKENCASNKAIVDSNNDVFRLFPCDCQQSHECFKGDKCDYKPEQEKKCCDKCSGYFPHRVGSHSDDYGGESDVSCFCNENEPCRKTDCSCHSHPKESLEWEESLMKHIISVVASATDGGTYLEPKDFRHFGEEIHEFTSLKSFIKSLLAEQRAELLKEIKISWDIADNGSEWCVQIWNGNMLLNSISKKSDDGGCFNLLDLINSSKGDK